MGGEELEGEFSRIGYGGIALYRESERKDMCFVRWGWERERDWVKGVKGRVGREGE